MPPRSADERLTRALILELFLTMAQQQSAAERSSERAALRSAREDQESAADAEAQDVAEDNRPPFPE